MKYSMVMGQNRHYALHRDGQYVFLGQQRAYGEAAEEFWQELQRLNAATNHTAQLVRALEIMLESHGMHGPCRQNNCSDCKYARNEAHAALDAVKPTASSQ